MSTLCLARRRKQRRGRYNGSCTRSGAAKSSQMCRAWWSSSLLSHGACPTESEPVLSCCTAGTSCYCCIRGQPLRAGTHQAAQHLATATTKPWARILGAALASLSCLQHSPTRATTTGVSAVLPWVGDAQQDRVGWILQASSMGTLGSYLPCQQRPPCHLHQCSQSSIPTILCCCMFSSWSL